MRLVAVLLLFAAACAHQPATPYAPGTFTQDGITLQYRLLSPPRVIPGQRYAMLVVFHGSGAIGTDNTAQIGPLAKSWATAERRAQYPVYVLIPQFSTRSAEYANGSSHATPALHAALALVEQMKRELPVDASRVYALGFSMGGSAVWNALALKPRLFSRAAVVAGVPNRDALARLGDTQLLLVHGDADTENPYAAARAAYEAADPSRVEFWRYEGLAHEFPQELIATPRLAEWLFATSRKSPAPSAR
jgi:predicted peptidase